MHSKNQKRHSSPCPSRALMVPMKPKVSVAPSPGDTLAFRVPRDYPYSRFSKAPLAVYPPKGARGRTCVSLPVVSLEKMPCLGRSEGGTHVRVSCSSSSPSSSSSSSSSSLKPSPSSSSSHRSQERLVNGRGPPTPRPSASPSPSDGRPSPAARSPLDKPFTSPLDRRHSPSPSPRPAPTLPSPAPRPAAPLPAPCSAPLPTPLKKKHQSETKNTKPHKRLSGRVFDPNKHCGVQDPESRRQCTRSLTCKTHSLTHRRAVPGRRKHFDVLLAEHKGRAKEKDGAKEREGAKERVGVQVRRESQGPPGAPAAAPGPSLDTPTSPPTPSKPSHLHNGRTVSTLRLRLANAHIPRVPGGIGGASASGSAPLQASSSASEGRASWVRVSGTDGRPSSDEGEGDVAEDTASLACPSSLHHPRPLGCCAFSSRLLGRGHYVFDRRWDKMRLALHYMVEKHVNAQMWRKVPLAAENPPAPHPPSATPQSAFSSPLGPPFSSVLPPSSSSEAFSLVSYAPALPQSASGTGVFNIRDPPRPPDPVSPAQGRPRNGTAKTSRLPREGHLEGAKRRKTSSSTSSLPSADPALRNGSSGGGGGGGSHPSPLPSLGPPVLAGRRKGTGRVGSGPGARAVDWYPEPTAPHPPSARDPTLPFSSGLQPPPPPPPPPPSSPLAYGGGAEGRKRRSPSSYGERPSKASKASGLDAIFRRSRGLLSAGPESPRQPKNHH